MSSKSSPKGKSPRKLRCVYCWRTIKEADQKHHEIEWHLGVLHEMVACEADCNPNYRTNTELLVNEKNTVDQDSEPTAPSDRSNNESGLPPAKSSCSESLGNPVSPNVSSIPSASKKTTGCVTQSMGPSSGQWTPVKITSTKGSGSPSRQPMPLSSGQKRSQRLPASCALSTMSSDIHGSKQSGVLTTIAGQHGMMGVHGSSGMGSVVTSGKTYTSPTTKVDPMMSSFPPNTSNHPVGGPRPKTITKEKVVQPFGIVEGNNSSAQGIVGLIGTTMTSTSSAGGKKPTIHINRFAR